MDLSAGAGKLCIYGNLGIVFIWDCFVSCLLFLLFYVSLRNWCSGTHRKNQNFQSKLRVELGGVTAGEGVAYCSNRKNMLPETPVGEEVHVNGFISIYTLD